MKLAISTLPCGGWNFEKIVDICKNNGIEGIELRIGDDPWSKDDMTDEYAAKMRRAAEISGLKLIDVASGVLVQKYDEAQFERYQKSLRIANLLQAKGVRIFLGNFLDKLTDPKNPIDHAGIVKWIREAGDMSGPLGVEVWVETHNEYATGKALKKLLTEVDRENVKIIWDIMHPIEEDETVDETIAEMWRYVAHLHIKDGKPPKDKNNANWNYTKLGDGVMPIAEIVKKTQALGFDGYYSLEWENLWRTEINTPDCAGEIIIPQFAEFMRGLN